MSVRRLRFGLSCFISLVIASLFVSAGAIARERLEVGIVPNIPHGSGVSSVAFAPDGRSVLSGGGNFGRGEMKLWDVATGQLLRTFVAADKVVSVAFSPDGTRVLSVDKAIKLWNAETGQLLLTIEAASLVSSVKFSPDGTRVLSGDLNRTLKLWDTATGQLLRTFEGHADYVWSVAFSPDGTRVLSGSADNTLKLWDAASGQLLRTFAGHARAVSSVAFSPDGLRVLSGGGDKMLRLWDAATGQLLHEFEGYGKLALFSPDGAFILSAGGEDQRPKLWDAATGQLLRTFEDASGVTSVAFSPDGTRVLVGSDRLKLWNAATGQLLRTFAGSAAAELSAAFSPDGARVYSAGEDAAFKVWDAASGQLSRTFALPAISDKTVSVESVLSPGGRHALLAREGWSKSRDVTLWDTAGPLLRSFPANARGESYALSADGSHFLSGHDCWSWDPCQVRLWDAASGQLLRTFAGHTKRVTAVAFSLDGTRVLSGSADNTLKLWDAASGQLLRTFEHGDYVYSIAFSHDGTRVLSGGGDKALKLWDAATGQLLRTFEGHADGVRSLAFAPDDTRVLSGSFDQTLKSWDVATGQLLCTCKGHADVVHSVAFSPGGAYAVSSSWDTTIRIWKPAACELLATLFGSADGDWLTITPGGYFAGSPKSASEKLGIVRGLKAYNIQQVYQALFDPDLVRESLAGDPDGEARKAAAAVDLERVLDSGEPPTVALLSPVNASTSKDELITAEARITDAGGGIGRVEWRVNGATVGVTNAPGSVIKQTLALEPGENGIEVLAYNRRNLLASVPASATVTWNAPRNQPRPKLFVVAVGINDYQDPHFPALSHAVDDAKALGAAIKAAGQGLYADVDVTYVLDAEATAAGLEKIVTAAGARMQPRDTFVFFAAAHGKSENGRFHLIPQDYRSTDGHFVTKGTIGQEQLQDWFANRIRARRALILLDTCESGALVAGRASGIDLGNSQAAMGRLNEAIGRPVLTAAAADQAALEGWKGHGVFTFALLDALVNGDTNGDGKIELSELVAHIQTLTPQLSREMRAGRGQAAPQKQAKRAAVALGDAPIASRYADYRQKPRLGSRGEDFPLVNRLSALPAAAQ